MGVERRDKGSALFHIMFNVLTASPNCGTGWHENPRTGQCYKLGEEFLCWSDAVSSCEAVGGTLLVPDDEEEQKFIKGLDLVIIKTHFSRMDFPH